MTATTLPRRKLGPDGPHVSAVGFGAMPLSIVGRPDEEASLRVLHAAFDAGVTLVDTADVYSLDGRDIGHNERLVARALASWSGDPGAVLVTTKGGSTHPEERVWRPDGRPEHLRAACEASLQALGVERIDLYQLHSVDPQVPYAESVGAVEELRREGKIRWVGVSNVGVPELEVARRITPVQTVENILSPFFRGALGRRRFLRPSLLSVCRRLGLGFLAYMPLGGWLNAKLPEHPVVAPIARRHSVTAHRVVLAWVLAQGPHVIPIPGARRVEHALDSTEAHTLELSREELRAIDRAAFPRDEG